MPNLNIKKQALSLLLMEYDRSTGVLFRIFSADQVNIRKLRAWLKDILEDEIPSEQMPLLIELIREGKRVTVANRAPSYVLLEQAEKLLVHWAIENFREPHLSQQDLSLLVSLIEASGTSEQRTEIVSTESANFEKTVYENLPKARQLLKWSTPEQRIEIINDFSSRDLPDSFVVQRNMLSLFQSFLSPQEFNEIAFGEKGNFSGYYYFSRVAELGKLPDLQEIWAWSTGLPLEKRREMIVEAYRRVSSAGDPAIIKELRGWWTETSQKCQNKTSEVVPTEQEVLGTEETKQGKEEEPSPGLKGPGLR